MKFIPYTLDAPKVIQTLGAAGRSQKYDVFISNNLNIRSLPVNTYRLLNRCLAYIAYDSLDILPKKLTITPLSNNFYRLFGTTHQGKLIAIISIKGRDILIYRAQP